MLPWPLPAVLSWAIAWGTYLGLCAVQAPVAVALLGGVAMGVVPSVCGPWPLTGWRRLFMGMGFPLSWLASGAAAGLPAWTWLLPLGVLALLYPLNAWRDAPFFPTPRGALQGLPMRVQLPAAARVLEAGCGLGHGLRELHVAYPQVQLDGVEWSWPLRLLCQFRCGYARITRGDLWKTDWSRYQMVYLFQRPESMPRVIDKARRELAPGAWIASLEFEATDLQPTASHACPDGRQVWLYQQPFTPRRAATAPHAR